MPETSTKTDQTVHDARLAMCMACANYIPATGRCCLDNKTIALKARLLAGTCPANLW